MGQLDGTKSIKRSVCDSCRGSEGVDDMLPNTMHTTQTTSKTTMRLPIILNVDKKTILLFGKHYSDSVFVCVYNVHGSVRTSLNRWRVHANKTALTHAQIRCSTLIVLFECLLCEAHQTLLKMIFISKWCKILRALRNSMVNIGDVLSHIAGPVAANNLRAAISRGCRGGDRYKKGKVAPFIQLLGVVFLIEFLLKSLEYISYLPPDTALLLASLSKGIVVGMRDVEQRLIVELIYVFVLCITVVCGQFDVYDVWTTVCISPLLDHDLKTYCEMVENKKFA